MKSYILENLSKEKANELFLENNGAIDVVTKSGTLYHIIKLSNGTIKCLSQYCYNERPLTKALKKVFC